MERNQMELLTGIVFILIGGIALLAPVFVSVQNLVLIVTVAVLVLALGSVLVGHSQTGRVV